MVAALLGEGPSVIENCPEVGDVDITAGMLRDLGCTVEVDDAVVTVEPGPLTSGRVPLGYGGLNRIPILLVGPLLHRMGEAFVPFVGGDRIGARPVDFHVSCLEAMGAEVSMTHEGLEAKATKLHGARIRLPFPSVGATETVLLTAVLAEGRTVLENSAVEPEVIELALFLQRMGARIELRPDRRFVIEGVDHLSGRPPHVGRRPHRGLQLPRGRPRDRRPRPGPRLRPGPPRHRHHRPAAHGRAVRDHRRLGGGRGRRAPPGGGADGHPSRLHDRLAVTPGRALHPVQRACRCCTSRCTRDASRTWRR